MALPTTPAPSSRSGRRFKVRRLFSLIFPASARSTQGEVRTYPFKGIADLIVAGNGTATSGIKNINSTGNFLLGGKGQFQDSFAQPANKHGERWRLLCYYQDCPVRYCHRHS